MFDSEVQTDLLAMADSVWEVVADLAVTVNDTFDPRCGCQIQHPGQ